jgi:hypothetical protein
MSDPNWSERIDIVIKADGSRRVLVNGQDITYWISADSHLTVDYGGPNTLPKLTLTLTANEIKTRQEVITPV